MMKLALTFDDIQIVPRYSEINSRKDCILETRFTKNIKIKIPFVSAPMDTVTEFQMAEAMNRLGGIGIVHRFMPIEEQIPSIQFMKPTCAAIGLNDKIRFERLINHGAADAILIDVAHGNTKRVIEDIKFYKKEYPDVEIIAGNVATRDGAINLCEAGVDAIRVGIGNGSLCETRIRTGIGIPQVTAIIDCVRVAEDYNVPVIADGGIRTPGDAAKALALGADTVMLGSLLSGTKETPGRLQKVGLWPNEQLFKQYRGSASLATKQDHNQDEKNVEGNSKLIPYKGKIKRIISDLEDGLRSSMSYVGAINLEEFRAKSEFVQVTQNGVIEAKPHLL